MTFKMPLCTYTNALNKTKQHIYMKEFDENEVVQQIRGNLSEESSALYSDDDLLNIVDMIWDFYEINGLLDIDSDDDSDPEDLRSDIVEYARRMLKKDKACKVKPEDLECIVDAELAYEDYLDSQL